MYPYLFGMENWRMYDLIGVIGGVMLLIFFICKRNNYFEPLSAEQRQARWHFWLFLAVQVVAYAFGGSYLGGFVSRSTEFFGYVTVSAVGMVLTAATLGYRPLRWLDRTVPLYLTLAATLKLSCFCSGCCYGLPWERGLWNMRQHQAQFPIQLAEMAAYAVLLCLLCRYRGGDGQRFALFVTGYAAVRFAVQFFRADVGVFTPFHWMSAVFFALGATMWAVCALYQKKCK